MAARRRAGLLADFCRLMGPSDEGDVRDDKLLARFVRRHEDEAFALLMRRHGAMVYGICRRVLRDEHDAEDAFQATFIVLARRASSIRQGASVAGWLGRVAHRLALAARATAARRRHIERQVAPMSSSEPDCPAAWRELGHVIDEEVARLPDTHHAAFVLCHLEGQTYEQAARQLGWPLGTLKLRLTQARERLRQRLARRGLALTPTALVSVLAADLQSAVVPTALAGPTLKSALAAAAGATSGPAPAVAVLVEGGLRQMFLLKLKTVAVTLLAMVSITGVGLAARQIFVDKGPAAERSDPSAASPTAAAQESEGQRPIRNPGGEGKASEGPGDRPGKKDSKEKPADEPDENRKTPPGAGKTVPPGVPVAIRLKSAKDTYVLDRGGKSAREYLEQIKDTNKANVFPPPDVELTIEVRNTSDKELKLWTGGDPFKIALELKGPGAHSQALPVAFDAVFKPPQTTVLGPGKTFAFKLSSLRFGFRGESHAAYWAEEGKYTLGAVVDTGVSPAPKEATPSELDKSVGLVRLVSEPIKLNVVLKGKEE
ncbi:MAG TPA: RNA polymerase sigma factor [Gemmataceae bacterium]|nr:RNA polymerase sigma factor [Gemmataceae bacterium]